MAAGTAKSSHRRRYEDEAPDVAFRDVESMVQHKKVARPRGLTGELQGPPVELELVIEPSPEEQRALDADALATIVELETDPTNTKLALAAEVARVHALSPKERLALGREFTDPEAIFIALEAIGTDVTALVRASWLKKQLHSDFVLPERNALPAEAMIGVGELRQIWNRRQTRKGQKHALPFIALSHVWRDKDHPDPNGETAKLLVRALCTRWHEFEARGVSDLRIHAHVHANVHTHVHTRMHAHTHARTHTRAHTRTCTHAHTQVSDLGVFIDYCSLYQARQVKAKVRARSAAFKAIAMWYAHRCTTVWHVSGASGTKLDQSSRGWTCFEMSLANLLKVSNTGGDADWPQLVDISLTGHAQTRAPRAVPREPLAFYSGHEAGDKKYSTPEDRDAIIAPMFRSTTYNIFGGVRELNYADGQWGEEGAAALAVILPLCVNLFKLTLLRNDVGDDGVRAIAHVLSLGGLRPLIQLNLWGCCMGDPGLVALAEACATCDGALKHLKWANLGANRISSEGIEVLAHRLGKKAMPALQTLGLEDNDIGDTGLAALAHACSGGDALRYLVMLGLGFNGIGDAGVAELASTLRSAGHPHPSPYPHTQLASTLRSAGHPHPSPYPHTPTPTLPLPLSLS